MVDYATQYLLERRPDFAPYLSDTGLAKTAPVAPMVETLEAPASVDDEYGALAAKAQIQLLRDPGEHPGPGDRPHRVCEDLVGRQGGTGATPGVITDPVGTGSSGQPGSISVSRITLNQFLPELDVTYVDLMLSTGEQAYVNRRFTDALRIFLWVRYTLADAYNTPGGPLLGQVEKARIYLRQIELSLDYYGLPLNYVPLLSYDFYKALLDSLLSYSTRIEAALVSLQQQRNNLDTARQSAKNTIVALDGAIQSAEQRIIELNGQIAALEKDIAAMKPEIENLWNELIAANDQFKRAVSRKQNRCGFVEILQCVAAVAALVSSGGTLITALVAAKTALSVAEPKDANGKPITGDISILKYRLGSLTPVISDAKDIADQYNKLKTMLNPSGPNVSSLPDDQAKLLVEKDKFDAELKDYLDLPEAQAYQQLMHRFVDLVLARNQKILEYNALWNKRDDARIRIYVMKSDQRDVGSVLSRTENPEIDFLAAFVERSYRAIKAEIVYAVYSASKSLNYFSGHLDDIEILQTDTATLSVASASLLTRFARAKEEQARPPQTYKNIVVDLKTMVSATSWKTFLQTGTVTFSISATSGIFGSMCRVHVSKIIIKSAELLRQKKQHSFILVHHGLSKVIDEAGKTTDFSHRPVVGATIYSAEGAVVAESDFAADVGDYVGVSPFASWTLSIPEAASLKLDRMQTLLLTLEGSFWPVAGRS